MLYRTLKRIIERGGYDPDEMEIKLDLFYAAGKLTKEQYEELIALLHPANLGEPQTLEEQISEQL